MTKSSDSTPVPPRIPDYELLRLVGVGSYGDVWIARTATGVYRAVKVVWRNRFEDEAPYEREFRGLREFERISLVGSRQLALLHVGRRNEEGFFYYVMELADDATTGGEIDPATYRPLTLREVRREGELSVKRVLELGVGMARGLAVLHEFGLVHRDIKPSNIIMVGGEPKLADIGLVTSATMALTFVGTEGFVAPEGPGTPAADVYAMGKVLYELSTGLDRKEFPQLPEAFSEREDRLAFLELNAVILRACEPDLKRRPEDARALVEDLLLVQAGKSVRRLWAAERGLARALKMVTVLAAIAAVAGAGAWFAWDRAQQEMALRAEAEAERDALARKTQYAGLIAQASAAVDRQEYGLSRHLAETAAHSLPDEIGPELAWIQRAARGDAHFVVRPKGREINRLAIDTSGRTLAILDAAHTLVLRELSSGREIARHEGVRGVAGWSVADSAWLCFSDTNHLLKIDESGVLDRSELRLADSTAPLTGLTTLGLSSRGSALVVEQTPGGRFAEIMGDGRISWVSPWDAGGVEEAWTIFRTTLSPHGKMAAVAWVRGQGEEAMFRLTLATDEGKVVDLSSPPVRPGSLGWLWEGVGSDCCWKSSTI